MANNFFDDDEAQDSLHQSTSYPSRGASTSRPPPLHGDRQSHSLHAEEENNEHAMMRDRQEEYSLPPPLAQRTSTSADTGKGRASTSAPDGNGPRHQHRQHARESSTASMNIDTYNLDTRPIVARRHAPQRQQRGGGFLDDNNDNDYNHTPNTPLAQDEGEEDDEEELEGDGGNYESDIQKLLRLYMDERMAPELLNYPEELMEVLLRNLEAQVGRWLWLLAVRGVLGA